eukprot:s840_g11.t1
MGLDGFGAQRGKLQAALGFGFATPLKSPMNPQELPRTATKLFNAGISLPFKLCASSSHLPKLRCNGLVKVKMQKKLCRSRPKHRPEPGGHWRHQKKCSGVPKIEIQSLVRST